MVLQIYVWSVKTGRLLDILSGHKGPVPSLAFSPTRVRGDDVKILILILDHVAETLEQVDEEVAKVWTASSLSLTKNDI